jgi:hypothetical protein
MRSLSLSSIQTHRPQRLARCFDDHLLLAWSTPTRLVGAGEGAGRHAGACEERGNFSLSLVFSRTLLCTRSFGAGRRERERAFPFPRAPLAHAHTHAHTHTHAHSTPGPWQGSALTSLTPAHQPWSPPRAGRGPRARPRWRRPRPSTCRTSAPWAVAPPRQPGRLPPPRPTGRPPWTRSSRAWSSSSAWGGSGGWGEKDTHRAGARALNPPRRPLPFT